MSLYSTYDKNHLVWAREQAISGGRKRAQTAKRDRFGRMLPKDDTVSLPEPVKHGQAGGQARAKAPRNSKGQYIKLQEGE